MTRIGSVRRSITSGNNRGVSGPSELEDGTPSGTTTSCWILATAPILSVWRGSRLAEELRLDGQAEDLVPVHRIAVDDDGTVAMIQRQDGLIRFFSPLGEPLGSFGRRGEGPGEFMAASYLGWRGDTLWVVDTRLWRLTFIAPSLESGMRSTSRASSDMRSSGTDSGAPRWVSDVSDGRP